MSKIVIAMLTSASLAGCGGEYEPPQLTPEVVAEEARVVALLERRDDHVFGGRGDCAVRILGIEGPSTYAWSTCTFRVDSGASSGTSAPIRIDGDTIHRPRDGAGYAESIRGMFPERLAEAVLEDKNRLRPSTE